MTMNRQQAISEASFCLRSAQSVNDPEYRSALLELAEWWNQQAEWPSESAPELKPQRRMQTVDRA
jgi:hypothetical protein